MTRMRWLRWVIFALIMWGVAATVGAALAEEQVNAPLVVGQTWLDPTPTQTATPSPTATATPLVGIVTDITDGDTVKINVYGTIVKVRYIGVDTPEGRQMGEEAECYYDWAFEMNKRLVLGKEVLLFSDQAPDDGSRMLYYVFVGGEFVNERLIESGCGFASTVPPNTRYAQRFIEAEEEARANWRGLWLECMPPNTAEPMTPGDLRITALCAFERDEYIRLTNTGEQPVTLTGWRIQSVISDGKTYLFEQEDSEDIVLRPYCSIFVHSGADAREPSASDAEPRHLQWGKGDIWNDSGDEALLINPEGIIVDRWRY